MKASYEMPEKFFAFAAIEDRIFKMPSRAEWQYFQNESEMREAFDKALASAIEDRKKKFFYTGIAVKDDLISRKKVGVFDPINMDFKFNDDAARNEFSELVLDRLEPKTVTCPNCQVF